MTKLKSARERAEKRRAAIIGKGIYYIYRGQRAGPPEGG